MQLVGGDSYLGYLDHLEVDPEEFTQLFNTILINVTGFFRDPPVWELLSEEAYSLPMMTAEALRPARPATRPLRSRACPRSCWHATSRATAKAMSCPRRGDAVHQRGAADHQ
jgi:hypothetical protein